MGQFNSQYLVCFEYHTEDGVWRGDETLIKDGPIPLNITELETLRTNVKSKYSAERVVFTTVVCLS